MQHLRCIAVYRLSYRTGGGPNSNVGRHANFDWPDEIARWSPKIRQRYKVFSKKDGWGL